MRIGFEKKTINGVTLLTVPQFEEAGGVNHCFTTRLGGVSQGELASLNMGLRRGDKKENVRENIRRVCAAIGANPKRFLVTKQVHKDRIYFADESDLGSDVFADPPYGACDGLATNAVDLAVMCYSADCVPLLFYDPVKKAVAATHAGWRGTFDRVGAKTIAALHAKYGCRAEDILCAIGPSIGPCHFETHEDVPKVVRAQFGPKAESLVKEAGGGKFFVDLWKANQLQLLECGVLDEHITLSGLCTVCHSDLFYSCRVQKEKMGNMAAVIAISR